MQNCQKIAKIMLTLYGATCKMVLTDLQKSVQMNTLFVNQRLFTVKKAGMRLYPEQYLSRVDIEYLVQLC